MISAADLFKHLPKPCNKIGYPTKQAAKLALRQVTSFRRHEASGRCEDHSYRCTNCGRWHLTSMSRETFHNLNRRLAECRHGVRNPQSGVFAR